MADDDDEQDEDELGRDDREPGGVDEDTAKGLNVVHKNVQEEKEKKGLEEREKLYE